VTQQGQARMGPLQSRSSSNGECLTYSLKPQFYNTTTTTTMTHNCTQTRMGHRANGSLDRPDRKEEEEEGMYDVAKI